MKAATEDNYIQGKPHKAICGFFSRNLAGQRKWYDIFTVPKGKRNLQPRIIYPARLSFRIGEVVSQKNKS